MPHTLRPHSSSGNSGTGGTVSSAIQPLSSSGSDGISSRYQRMTVADVGQVVEHRAADDRAAFADVVAAEGERGDDAEVPAAAAQRPEQVAVRVLAGRHQRAVGEHYVGGQQVVDGEAEAPGQVADAAAERQACHAGGREEAGRSGHAERHGRVIDVPPGAAGVGADGVILRADRGAAQQRQVDDQGVVPYPEAGCVVTAAADGDLHALVAAETHAGDDVGGVAAARDGSGMLVDHGVVDGACRVVAGISRHYQLASQCSGQLLERPGGDVGRCRSHVGPFPVHCPDVTGAPRS